MANMMKFSAFFEIVRTRLQELYEQGVPVKDLAKKAGVSKQTIYKVMNQERGQQPAFGTTINLALATGMTMTEIFETLSPGKAVKIAKLYETYPDIFDVLETVLLQGSKEDKEKIYADLQYAAKKSRE